MDIVSIFFNMKVYWMFSLESEAILISTHNLQFSDP